ncbi:GNAT family N-acetyltransferase [Congregibacter litoralis]|nr:GNAT family N-acetyltransferase [Congregibacter litoralis]
MIDSLRFEPLKVEHLEELSAVLLHPVIYEHIEDKLPSAQDFKLGLERAIAGPGPSHAAELWLNFLVRESSGSMIGRLEATVHHGLAEVAFLFGRYWWGRGLASRGLHWLHEELIASVGVTDFWATTTPANVRCQRLLQRSGYHLAAPPASPLYSYDPGDLVFHKCCAA